MTSTLRKLERVQLTDTKVKVVMSKRILDQIKYLCRAIPKVEWSGVLFYSIEGSIKDPENMVCTLEDILPMHKGTGSYTEYSFDERVMDYLIDTDCMDKGWKMGHIHSHNSMAVFFSGTDWSELEDNAPNHNVYLSLIVNNWMDFCAKVCFIAEAKESKDYNFVCKDENGESYIHSTKSYNIEDRQLISYDCNIKTPNDTISTEPEFQAKVAGIIEAAKPKPVVRTYNSWERGGSNSVGFQTTKSLIENTPRNITRIIAGAKKERVEKEEDEYPSFTQRDFLGKSTESKPEITGKADIVEFAMYVLYMGNDISPFEDVEDVVNFYEEYNTNGVDLSKSILERYSALYEKYFDHIDNSEDPGVFVATTEAIIEEYMHEISMSMDPFLGALLRPVVAALQRLIINFNKTLV